MRGVTTTKTRKTDLFVSQGHITRSDVNRAFLLVGFFEYGNALYNFGQLLQRCSADELAAMDQIVKRYPEYAVYSNLSNKVISGPSSLQQDRTSDYSQDKLHGFASVIALARVEFGAMLAGFTDSPNPYFFVPVHAFDQNEFHTLLLDGAKTHYWSLLNDPQLKRVTTTVPSNPIVLAYSRRLLTARSMLAAATRLGHAEYSNVQMRELASWKDALDSVQGILVSNIQIYLQDLSVTKTKDSTKVQEYSTACQAMLRAANANATSGK